MRRWKEFGDKAAPQKERVLRAIELLESGDSRQKDMAAWARRTGIVTDAMYQHALRLVKSCGICGRKALYHWGLEGRCSEHRKIKTAGREWVEGQYLARDKDCEAVLRRSDAYALGAPVGRAARTVRGLRSGR